MRFRSIRLQWFRGAAETAQLNLDGKSVLVFGANGSGKSSFVDGIEAILEGGKVGHLTHEYSGRYQEKGLINTERPSGQKSSVEITLEDGSTEKLTWNSGWPEHSKVGSTSMVDWDYRRTVLRQEDLSKFINMRKGEKYSVILPLLGLDRLESVADNLRKLARACESKANLSTLRAEIDSAGVRRKDTFGEKTGEQLNQILNELISLYASDLSSGSPKECLSAITLRIKSRIASLEVEQRRSAAIQEISVCTLRNRLIKALEPTLKIAEITESLIRERLEILGAANSFLAGSIGVVRIGSCPACGQDVDELEFREHIDNELARLSGVQKLYDEQRQYVGDVCDELARLRDTLLKNELESWLKGFSTEQAECVSYLLALPINELRARCGLTELRQIEALVCPIIMQAMVDAQTLPPQVLTLVEHQNQARALVELLRAREQRKVLNRVELLINTIKHLEVGVRQEIAERARHIFDGISADIQRMWKLLQPNDTITDVRLEVPVDGDKAIDIVLDFFGKQQNSPRLTLSEGQRNALGLCTFLAMANRPGGEDRPIVLDDVVISFDREHRSRVARLLMEEFATRQILLLTHDREWYFELSRCLPPQKWISIRLHPYENPAEGICFIDHALDFANARARANSSPEEALAMVRRLMDVALSELAERLKLRMPYLRGNDNDHRTAGQYLVALEKGAPRCFKIRQGETYEKSEEAISLIRRASPELAVWGNRGTHTFSGSRREAEDLIDSCEALLKSFECSECGTPVGVHPGAGGKLECRCGHLQWRPD